MYADFEDTPVQEVNFEKKLLSLLREVVQGLGKEKEIKVNAPQVTVYPSNTVSVPETKVEVLPAKPIKTWVFEFQRDDFGRLERIVAKAKE